MNTFMEDYKELNEVVQAAHDTEDALIAAQANHVHVKQWSLAAPQPTPESDVYIDGGNIDTMSCTVRFPSDDVYATANLQPFTMTFSGEAYIILDGQKVQRKHIQPQYPVFRLQYIFDRVNNTRGRMGEQQEKRARKLYPFIQRDIQEALHVAGWLPFGEALGYGVSGTLWVFYPTGTTDITHAHTDTEVKNFFRGWWERISIPEVVSLDWLQDYHKIDQINALAVLQAMYYDESLDAARRYLIDRIGARDTACYKRVQQEFMRYAGYPCVSPICPYYCYTPPVLYTVNTDG